MLLLILFNQLREHRQITESLPARALGCLAAEESVVISEHLTACQVCRQEFNAFQTVTDQLVLAVPDVQPRPDVKTRILQEAAISGGHSGIIRGKIRRVFPRGDEVWPRDVPLRKI